MNTDDRSFYKDKTYDALLWIACVVGMGIVLWVMPNGNYRPEVTGLMLVLFGVLFVVITRRLMSRAPYVVTSSSFVKIGSYERLYWSDVTGARIFMRQGRKTWLFDVKNIAKYKLTFGQKLKRMLGAPAFDIPLMYLPPKDQQELEEILKRHVPKK